MPPPFPPVFMMAAAITNGHLIVDNCPLDALISVCDQLEHIGVSVKLAAGSADPKNGVCTKLK